nr:xylulose kinase-1 [Tanacetum cinerariifolium]
MVAYLIKSDASEGYNQVIDFLNGSYIKYALTVNPNIYVSCIKQFWNTVAINQVNDVTRLQALVDKKKMVVTEAAIREVLCLDDAEGVDCLPNEEIFTELARMGYEKPSTKLTFYKAFFSSQWKVLWVETPLFEGMLVGQEIKEEGDADANVEDVTAGDAALGDDNVVHGEVPTLPQEPSIPSPTPPTPPPQPPQDHPSTSQGEEIREKEQGGMIDEMDKDDAVVLMDDKKEDKKVEEVKVDESVQEDEPAELQEVVDVVTTAKLITKVVTAASETVTAASAIIPTAEPQVLAATFTTAITRVVVAPSRRRKGVVIRDPEKESTTSSIISTETKSKDKGKGILVEEPKPLKKKQQIEMDEEYARKLHDELNKDIDWDVAINHVKLKAKEDPAIKRYQAIKRKPQTEAQARKNIMMYLKNVAGFRLDYFKGMPYDDMRPIFKAKFNSNVDFILKIKELMEEEENRALQTINETPAEKVAKRRKLNKGVKVFKRHLEIMPNEDDDVYTEATLLARKVPIVNYKIIDLNNKPHYKIIRADGTYQLCTCLNLEESKNCTWSSKGQELEATGIMWCAYHNLYNHSADFVSGKEVPTLKVYSRPDVDCRFPAQSIGSFNTEALDSLWLLVLITEMSQSRQHDPSGSGRIIGLIPNLNHLMTSLTS